MKFITSLSILFLWVAIATPILCCRGCGDCEAVVDIEGKNLEPDVLYYILPVGGGGLGLGAGNQVVQMNSEVAEGMPVILRPFNTSDKVICLSTDTNIAFSTQTSAWTLASDGVRVTSTGNIDPPGEISELTNWFKIESRRRRRHYHHSQHRYYKLAFCPSITVGGKFYNGTCGDLGIFIEDDGERWLGLNGTTSLPVEFKRA